MYNLRYHIASLVAVFLALALGLVLGSIVVERGTFDRQQQALVAGLQQDFNNLLKEHSAVKADLAADEDLLDVLMVQAIGENLKDRTVIVLVNSGRTDGLDLALNAIRAGGGIPAVITLAKPGLDLDSVAVSAAATSVVGARDATELEESVVASLAAEWTAPLTERPLTEALKKAGAFKTDGLGAGVAASGVVVLAAFDGKPDSAALQIGKAFDALGLGAIGAQTRTRDTGVAAAFADAKLSTIDHLGTKQGAYSLVLVLDGTARGHFGTGSGATALFPSAP